MESVPAWLILLPHSFGPLRRNTLLRPSGWLRRRNFKKLRQFGRFPYWESHFGKVFFVPTENRTFRKKDLNRVLKMPKMLLADRGFETPYFWP